MREARSGLAASNPRPTRRPGATYASLMTPRVTGVPILARPVGRAQHKLVEHNLMLVQFQSSPDLRVGRNPGHAHRPSPHRGSNPRPTRRPGAPLSNHTAPWSRRLTYERGEFHAVREVFPIH